MPETPPAPRIPRLLRWLVVALLVYTYVITAAPAVWSGRLGVNNFQDDAFYYLVPAKHFVASGTFTFDGEVRTNGFHPLWMGAIVGLVAATGANAAPETHVLALKLLESVVLGVALTVCLAFFLRADRECSPRAIGYLCVATFLLWPRYIIFEQGMETTLVVLFFIVAIEMLLRDRPVALGLTLVAMFLCRLDTGIFVAMPMAAWAVLRGSGPIKQRLWAIVPLVVALILVPLTYLMVTGHPVPISGALKSSFPRVTWHGSYFTETFNIVGLYGWSNFLALSLPSCSFVLLLGTLAVLVARMSRSLRYTLLVVAAIGAILLANLLLFQRWEKSVDPRYYALPMTAALFVLGTGVAGTFAWKPPGSVAAAVPVLAIIVLLGAAASEATARAPARWSEEADFTTATYRAIEKVLPKDAVAAGTDVGAFAFWTGRKVINLDGLMNDYAYQEVLRDGKLAEYLRRRGVTHIGTPLWEAEQTYTGRPTEPMYLSNIDPAATKGQPYDCHRFYVYSYVFAKFSDELCLRQSAEVYRVSAGRLGIGEIAFVVYEMPR